jgi:hypothetical protein
MPVTQNLFLYRGDTKLLTILVKDLAGSIFDFTDAWAKWWLTRNPDSIGDDVLITKSTAVGGGMVILTPATGGLVQVQLDEHDTDLDTGLYYHELKVWKGTDIATSMRGTVYMRATLSMPAGDPLLTDELLIASPEFGAPVVVAVP